MSRLYTILLHLAALVLWGTGLSRRAPYLESSALLKDALPAFAGLAALAGLVVKGVLTSRMPLEERHPLNSALALTILFSIVVAYADLFSLSLTVPTRGNPCSAWGFALFLLFQTCYNPVISSWAHAR